MSNITKQKNKSALSQLRDGHAAENGHDHADDTTANGLVPEEYARLHADIERISSPTRCFVVGITSAVYGEGKTTVAMNLASTIAQNSTQRVALVDCNLRNCELQTRLNLTSSQGLVNVLDGDIDDLETVIYRTELDNFTVIPAGRVASNPSRLARSNRLVEVMHALRSRNEFMVVDMGPVLPVAETRVLARSLDGIVMVVRSGVTPRDVVKRAIDTIGNERVLGVVLNGTETYMPRWLQRFFS